MDLFGQDEAGQGDGLQILVVIARRGGVHGRAPLGQEVLDDYLLDVAPAPVGLGDGLQRVYPVGPGLADSHQDASGERDGQLASGIQSG